MKFVKYLFLLLVLLLVSSLLLESAGVGSKEERRERRRRRRKNKNKKKNRTTTVGLVTTDSEIKAIENITMPTIIQQSSAEKKSSSKTILEISTTYPVAMVTVADLSPQTNGDGMSSIIDMLFGYDYDSSYSEYDDETTANETSQTTIVTEETSAVMTNVGIDPRTISSTHSLQIEEEITEEKMTLSHKRMSSKPADVITSDVMLGCDDDKYSLLVKLKMQLHVANGEISFLDAAVIKVGEYTEEQKLEKVKALLAENGLAPLPDCIPPTKEVHVGKEPISKEDVNLSTSTKKNDVMMTQSKVVTSSTKTTTVDAMPQLVKDMTLRNENMTSSSEDAATSESENEEINKNNVTNAMGDVTMTSLSKPQCQSRMNASNLEEVLTTSRRMEEAGMLPPGVSQRTAAGEMTVMELLKMMRDAAIKAGRIPEECMEDQQSGRMPEPEGSYGQKKKREQLKMLQGYIQAGYLPPDTIEKLLRGDITPEWLRANITNNREIILSRMPEVLRTLIEDGKMPEDIETAIFSGKYNSTEIAMMIIADDDLIKAMLPTDFRNMIQDRPIPMKMKLLLISGKNSSEIKEEILSDDDLLKEVMVPSSYFFFNLFKVQRNRTINVVISVLVVVVLAFVMVSLGCTMTVSKIMEHARKPKGVIIALVAQFCIMPASAYGLTQAFQLDTYAAIAVLICGCCPGGNLSNMLAYSLNGDMDLSILMTTCSSVIGLGMMPLSIYLYSKLITPLSADIVPFDKIIINILLTIFPVIVGIIIRHYRPQWTTIIMRIGGLVLLLCSITVAVLAGIMLGDAFFVYFPVPVLACCAILPMSGYILGYFFAFLFRENPKCRRTICVETGCQNVQLCGTVLKLAFDPIIVGVLFLLPLVYMAFQVMEAFLIIMIFRVYNRCRGGKEKGEEKSGSEEKEEKRKQPDMELENGTKIEAKDASPLLNKSTTSNIDDMPPPPDQFKPVKTDQDQDSDIETLWPLKGEPTPAYLDSFKKAGTENFV
uniref:uncharacterized protein LOC100186727 isoform X2 n=2 Tax=Ciona intestinalis TaxID=7719 RepID=UPI0002B8E950|nr:uncharacterized protein LOC100186727 isoform X2 [Ciona intestinalis]|eukprot:XP_002124965.2 uncharacterized protein LOC100186727 isoform X2 [Ciona intestinalis]